MPKSSRLTVQPVACKALMKRRASCRSDTTEVSVTSTSSRSGDTPLRFNSLPMNAGTVSSISDRPETFTASAGMVASRARLSIA